MVQWRLIHYISTPPPWPVSNSTAQEFDAPVLGPPDLGVRPPGHFVTTPVITQQRDRSCQPRLGLVQPTIDASSDATSWIPPIRRSHSQLARLSFLTPLRGCP